MKIVILDGYSANPGDMSWEELEDLGEVTVYDRTRPEETVTRAAEATIVLTNKVIINKEVIAQLPRLKYVGVLTIDADGEIYSDLAKKNPDNAEIQSRLEEVKKLCREKFGEV